ncbi:MAG: tyrosine-type recombinase/integrase, partial [Fibromonadaceae bacterium]|nr:tyrosine-type recombinase/integrase [Fibromonadaceae bacterium]
MAKAYKVKINNNTYVRLQDTAFGQKIQYLINLDKFSAKQWVVAHNAIMQAINPADRQHMSGSQIKRLAQDWLNSPKNIKVDAKTTGIKIDNILTNAEAKISSVFESYLSDYCRPGINTQTAIERTKRHCKILQEFLEVNKIKEYSKLQRGVFAKYPEWRSTNRKDNKKNIASANTINQELNRMAAIIKHGVKYHNWRERYLLDGIRVKAVQENTKAVRPFDIVEVKIILEWLQNYSEKLNTWHLHDMVLLALCTGLEAKALDLLEKDWFKIDFGIIRVYDKLISGIIDAKTQNRARDVPLTLTLCKLYDRGYIFKRDSRARFVSKKGTKFRHWAESILCKAEKETGITDINLHRFRHTCATARLSAGWQLIRVSRMLGHSNINTTAQHYAE